MSELECRDSQYIYIYIYSIYDDDGDDDEGTRVRSSCGRYSLLWFPLSVCERPMSELQRCLNSNVVIRNIYIFNI
jgi:hypothetical protein